jgi:hypothetical protein
VPLSPGIALKSRPEDGRECHFFLAGPGFVGALRRKPHLGKTFRIKQAHRMPPVALQKPATTPVFFHRASVRKAIPRQDIRSRAGPVRSVAIGGND